MNVEPDEPEDGSRPKRETGDWVPPLRGKIPPGTPPFDIHKFREELYEGGPRPRPRRIRLEKLGTLKVPPGVPPLDIAEFREQVYDPALGE